MRKIKLGYYFFVKGGSTPSTSISEYWNGTIPWITPADLKDQKLEYVSDSRQHTTPAGVQSANLIVGQEGWLIFSSRAPIGKVAISRGPLCINQGCKFLHVKPGVAYNTKFLGYWLMSQIEELNRLGVGATFKEISTSALQEFKIPCIPIEKQNNIVALLDARVKTIDALRACMKDKLKQINEYRQSLITHAVTRGLNPKAKTKPSGISWLGEIPFSWVSTSIGKVMDVTLGKMLSANKTDPSQSEENYLCAGNIAWSGVKTNLIKRMWFSTKEKKTLLLKAGDILIVEGGAGFGTATTYSGEVAPCYIQNSVVRLREKGPIKAEFCRIWLNFTYGAYLKRVCNEATFSHYTKEKVIQTPIVVPPLDEQIQIIAFMKNQEEKISNLLLNIQNEEIQLVEYQKSLISSAFDSSLRGDAQ